MRDVANGGSCLAGLQVQSWPAADEYSSEVQQRRRLLPDRSAPQRRTRAQGDRLRRTSVQFASRGSSVTLVVARPPTVDPVAGRPAGGLTTSRSATEPSAADASDALNHVTVVRPGTALRGEVGARRAFPCRQCSTGLGIFSMVYPWRTVRIGHKRWAVARGPEPRSAGHRAPMRTDR